MTLKSWRCTLGNHNRVLDISGLQSGYGSLEILHGIDMHVHEHEIVSIIGPNGCGKSTVLRSIMNLTSWSRGQVSFLGNNIVDTDTSEIVMSGIGYVPQLENVFAAMTVTENLHLGGYLLSKSDREKQTEAMFELFPMFKERSNQTAGTMSGGERQTLALAMALLTAPKLVLLDEPSSGLSPKATNEMYERIVDLPTRLGASILIVEQDVHGVLEITSRTYVMSMGENDFDAPSDTIWDDDRVRLAYLGNIEDDRKV